MTRREDSTRMNFMSAEYYIRHLQLRPHPEGGFFRETYRSVGQIRSAGLPEPYAGKRNYSTAIYFLLTQNHFSAFHRIYSDECWHHYEGGTLLIHMIDPDGNYSCIRLGKKVAAGETFQFVVPGSCWFASEPAPGTDYVLVGCTVAPGFDFADFEMADANKLSMAYPDHHQLIHRLCR